MQDERMFERERALMKNHIIKDNGTPALPNVLIESVDEKRLPERLKLQNRFPYANSAFWIKNPKYAERHSKFSTTSLYIFSGRMNLRKNPTRHLYNCLVLNTVKPLDSMIKSFQQFKKHGWLSNSIYLFANIITPTNTEIARVLNKSLHTIDRINDPYMAIREKLITIPNTEVLDAPNIYKLPRKIHNIAIFLKGIQTV